jgi:hypothetical protein
VITSSGCRRILSMISTVCCMLGKDGDAFNPMDCDPSVPLIVAVVAPLGVSVEWG